MNINGYLLISILWVFYSSSPVSFFDDLEDFYIIPILFNQSYSDLMMIYMLIEDPKMTYKSVIDINLNDSWIYTSEKQDNSLEPMTYYGSRCNGKNGIGESHIVSIGNMTIRNMTIVKYSSIEGNCEYQSAIGFSISYENKSFSLFEELNREYMSRIVGFYHNTMTHEKYMRLGFQDIYNESYRNRVSICKVMKNQRWNCNLNGIIIGSLDSFDQSPKGDINYIKEDHSQLYSLNKPIFFESLHRLIFIPKNYFVKCIHPIFKSFIYETQDCIITNKEGLFVIICKESIISKIPSIHFIIDNYLLSFESNSLFVEERNNKNNYTHLFIIGRNLIDHDEFVFGNIIMDIVDVVFDYRLNTIQMIHKEETITQKVKILGQNSDLDKRSLLFIEQIFYVMNITGLIGMIVIMISLFRQKEIIGLKWIFQQN